MDTRSSGSRGFNPMQIPGLPEEARKAVKAAFDAMQQWRHDMAAQGERNSEQMFQAMTAAAKAMGWPTQVIEATRAHMQGVSRMQVQMMDQMMNAWEEQLKSPNPMGSFPATMMENLKSLPGFPGGASWPGMEAMGGSGAMPMNPMQFWMQVGEQWQKNWAQAMTFWANAGMGGDQGRK